MVAFACLAGLAGLHGRAKTGVLRDRANSHTMRNKVLQFRVRRDSPGETRRFRLVASAVAYSYRNASTGFSFAARRAG
jgi:hypothetical protein